MMLVAEPKVPVIAMRGPGGLKSNSLQRRVGSKPVPTSVHAHRLGEQKLANWRGGPYAVYPLGPLTLGARLALADA
jgi:hypothetical protein